MTQQPTVDPLDELDDERLYPSRLWAPTPEDIAHLAPEDKLDVAEYDLGIEMEMLQKSPAGRFMVGRAKIEWEQARDELCRVDPENPGAVRAAQMKAAVAARVLSWMADCIAHGNRAAKAIQMRANQPDEDPGY